MLKWMMAATAALMLMVAPAMAITLEPVDESTKDPELAALIQTLLKACDDKDFKPFEAALSPEAMASFGGEKGVEGFKKEFKIDDPKTTFYSDFKTALTMGGAFIDEQTYGTPYVYAKWPHDVDAFTHVASIATNVYIYEKPSVLSTPMADASYAVLEVLPDAQDTKTPTPAGWLHVKYDDAQTSGYVKKEKTRSSVDYRAIFQKTKNRWWLGAFASGD